MKERELILKSQIDVLNGLQYTTAYTGELGKVKHGTYVSYNEVIKVLNQKKQELQKLKEEDKKFSFKRLKDKLSPK